MNINAESVNTLLPNGNLQCMYIKYNTFKFGSSNKIELSIRKYHSVFVHLKNDKLISVIALKYLIKIQHPFMNKNKTETKRFANHELKVPFLIKGYLYNLYQTLPLLM